MKDKTLSPTITIGPVTYTAVAGKYCSVAKNTRSLTFSIELSAIFNCKWILCIPTIEPLRTSSRSSLHSTGAGQSDKYCLYNYSLTKNQSGKNK